MLFDQASYELAPQMVKAVLDVMEALAKQGRAMMCVTHDMGFARKVAKRVICINRGQTVDDCSKHACFGGSASRPAHAAQFLWKILRH